MKCAGACRGVMGEEAAREKSEMVIVIVIVRDNDNDEIDA